MIHWRQKVLDLFQAPFSHLTLVSDPDQLLDDEIIISKIKEHGLEIIKFQDRASFRFEYESHYKKPDQSMNLIIVSNSADLVDLPFDLWSSAQKVELRKNNLFPQLAVNVVRQLDTRTLDLLSGVSMEGNLSYERATIDLILRHVYGLAYDSVHSLTDCLLLIMRWHELRCDVPEVIKQYLVEYLQSRKTDIPVQEWITSYHAFCQYLQQEWHRFVEEEFPKSHTFWDPSVRSALSLLFLEGVLLPVSIKHDSFPNVFSWGLYYDSKMQKQDTVKGLEKQLETLLSAVIDRRTWIQIARTYGKAKCISLELQLQEDDGCLSVAMEKEIEARFEQWLVDHYGALATLTDRNSPVMVHKAVEVLRLKEKDKVALIVCDGMSFVQWAQIEQTLADDYQYEVYGSYAWIPTLTSVSRQSIFSGEIPRFFYDSINTTAKEEKSWKSTWERNGVPSGYVSYERGLGQGVYERSNIAALTKSNTKVAGLVVDTIDQLTHHTIQGQLGLYAAIGVWLKQGYLHSLLTDLLDADYDVYLTSDHGNKESKGVGRASDGTLPETRGERVRVYRDVVLRDQAAVQYSSRQWSGTGLPDDYHVLIARSGEAFVREGEIVVSHGGTSIEEVIVPFVHIQKR
ncbi:BREX-3 system phosphatase PglZ [Brevibacillus centrosporus]|uniref:BREX-3 system phosphatase PglZ n=1 Tax=Brevibacillus centrosporus TaxID=54910 RepID=UPI0011685E36|nr:BREX-3 system phosphatase PglZ [Brevibacillus centrosporus]MEC2130245.1 BREX-3 system phosphatase PglZ [Brevibacillus centrosporus]GED30275.1 alkaline phosphatase [Brevibacillus centrosporus]